jgi:hypothetical protein
MSSPVPVWFQVLVSVLVFSCRLVAGAAAALLAKQSAGDQRRRHPADDSGGDRDAVVAEPAAHRWRRPVGDGADLRVHEDRRASCPSTAPAKKPGTRRRGRREILSPPYGREPIGALHFYLSQRCDLVRWLVPPGPAHGAGSDPHAVRSRLADRGPSRPATAARSYRRAAHWRLPLGGGQEPVAPRLSPGGSCPLLAPWGFRAPLIVARPAVTGRRCRPASGTGPSGANQRPPQGGLGGSICSALLCSVAIDHVIDHTIGGVIDHLIDRPIDHPIDHLSPPWTRGYAGDRSPDRSPDRSGDRSLIDRGDRSRDRSLQEGVIDHRSISQRGGR